MRFNLYPREAATFVKLRNLGYSINCIAKAFGRSTSLVHRILRFNLLLRSVPHMDLRKLGNPYRTLSAINRWELLQKFLPGWERFALTSEGKPP